MVCRVYSAGTTLNWDLDRKLSKIANVAPSGVRAYNIEVLLRSRCCDIE